MAKRNDKPYSEETGMDLIKAYNKALDNIQSDRDPTKVLRELGRVAVVGLGGDVDNEDYLGQLLADEDVQKMAQAIALYKIDRNEGLKALAEASDRVHLRLVKRYAFGFARQEDIKPKKDEAESLAKAADEIYTKWVLPQEQRENSGLVSRLKAA